MDDCEEGQLCDCGHGRRRHNNGEFECRRCDCKGWTPCVVPDLFDDMETDALLDDTAGDCSRKEY